MNKNSLFIDLNSLPLTIASLKELTNPLNSPPRVTSQGFTKDIIQDFTCMVCQDILSNPVTTNCVCQATLCSECFSKNHSKCPICRKYIDAHPNQRIQNRLSSLDIMCGCGLKYKYGSKSDHEVICKNAKFNCGKCGMAMNGPEMVEHLKNSHYLQILMFFAKAGND